MIADDKLIAQQAREIATLKEEAAEFTVVKQTILRYLCGIGGPLNDNRLAYTEDQLAIFRKIHHLILD